VQKEDEKKKKRENEMAEDERIKKELEVIRERYDEEVNGKKKKIMETQVKNIVMLEKFLKEDEKEKQNKHAGKRKGKVIDFEPILNSKSNNPVNQNENEGIHSKY